MSGTGKKFNEITHRTTSLEEHGWSLLRIKEWRATEMSAGDHRAWMILSHTRTLFCVRLLWPPDDGVGRRSRVPLWTVCAKCGGSGRVPTA